MPDNYKMKETDHPIGKLIRIFNQGEASDLLLFFRDHEINQYMDICGRFSINRPDLALLCLKTCIKTTPSNQKKELHLEEFIFGHLGRNQEVDQEVLDFITKRLSYSSLTKILGFHCSLPAEDNQKNNHVFFSVMERIQTLKREDVQSLLRRYINRNKASYGHDDDEDIIETKKIINTILNRADFSGDSLKEKVNFLTSEINIADVIRYPREYMEICLHPSLVSASPSFLKEFAQHFTPLNAWLGKTSALAEKEILKSHIDIKSNENQSIKIRKI